MEGRLSIRVDGSTLRQPRYKEVQGTAIVSLAPSYLPSRLVLCEAIQLLLASPTATRTRTG